MIAFLALLCVALVLGAWWVRAAAGVGFGLGAGCADCEQLTAGFLFRLEDALSYVTWIQQARAGHVLFQDPFAVEPHARALFNPLFLVLGRLAALLDVHPIALLNALGLAAIPLSAGLVYAIGRRLGLPGRAALYAVALYFTAAGLTEPARRLRALVRKLGGDFELEYALDWLFPDLFPVYLILSFPYHHLANALVLGVLALALRAERSAAEGRAEPLVSVALLALAATLSRPYEPTALLVVYALHALLRLVVLPDEARRRRLRVAGVLGLAIGAGTLYNAWLARQAVWSEFAGHSLALPNSRYAVVVGFGLLWLGAVWGTRAAAARGRPGLLLASVWTGLVAFVFAVLNLPQTKLAGCAMAAFAWLGGLALHEAVEGARRQPAAWRRLAAGAAIAAALWMLVATPISLVERFLRDDYALPRVDREIVASARRAADASGRPERGGRAPLVVTEVAAGRLLPALAHLRVYAGHWSLTPRFEAKRARLLASGIEPREAGEEAAEGDAAPRGGEAPARLLDAASADFVLLRATAPALETLAASARAEPLYEGERWRLFRWSPR